MPRGDGQPAGAPRKRYVVEGLARTRTEGRNGGPRPPKGQSKAEVRLAARQEKAAKLGTKAPGSLSGRK